MWPFCLASLVDVFSRLILMVAQASATLWLNGVP